MGFEPILPLSVHFSGLLVDDKGGGHDLSHEVSHHKTLTVYSAPAGEWTVKALPTLLYEIKRLQILAGE
jgi:hypothetical protein